MTGFNHTTTGALIAAASGGNPYVALPLAFLSHFLLDAIPHFGWDFDMDVFERNKTRSFKVVIALEFPLTIAALAILPLVMRPISPWWVTLASMAAAIFMDLIWVYRGIREVVTKKFKPRNKIMDFHLRISHHHQKVVPGIIWELGYLIAALAFILWRVGAA